MDLQLHEGYAMKPRKVLTNKGQLLRAAYGTPTYFQFLNETGLDEDYPIETLEGGWWDFVKSAPKKVGGAVKSAVQATGAGIKKAAVAGANVAPGIFGPTADAIRFIESPKTFSFKGSDTLKGVKQAAAVVVPMVLPGAAKAVQSVGVDPSQLITNVLTPQQKPVVAMLPAETAIPAPDQTQFLPMARMAAMPAATPSAAPATFAGMNLQTLLLLGLGGFVAYNFLSKK
jgi:hypothetical protein